MQHLNSAAAARSGRTGHSGHSGRSGFHIRGFGVGTSSGLTRRIRFAGANGGSYRAGPRLLQDANGSPFADNWGSAHTGTANFLNADGSVRGLRYSLDNTNEVKGYLTRSGGETFNLD